LWLGPAARPAFAAVRRAGNRYRHHGRPAALDLDLAAVVVIVVADR